MLIVLIIVTFLVWCVVGTLAIIVHRREKKLEQKELETTSAEELLEEKRRQEYYNEIDFRKQYSEYPALSQLYPLTPRPGQMHGESPVEYRARLIETREQTELEKMNDAEKRTLQEDSDVPTPCSSWVVRYWE